MESGGTLDDFADVATDDTRNDLSGAGGSSNCLIQHSLSGTQFEAELSNIRTWRDQRLLDNPVGTFIADSYYRLSSWVLRSTGETDR
jgi:hypothetical protein